MVDVDSAHTTPIPIVVTGGTISNPTLTTSGIWSPAPEDSNEPDRGRRAWGLLRREWGAAVADALWRGQPVKFLARNRCLYEIRPGPDWFAVVNLTRDTGMCVDIERGHAYPLADRLLGVLDHLRVHPEVVEREAQHRPLHPTRFIAGMQYALLRRLELWPLPL